MMLRGPVGQRRDSGEERYFVADFCCQELRIKTTSSGCTTYNHVTALETIGTGICNKASKRAVIPAGDASRKSKYR